MKTSNFKNRIVKSMATFALCGSFLVVGCSKDSLENDISSEEAIENEIDIDDSVTQKGKRYNGSVVTKVIGSSYYVVRFSCSTSKKRNQVKGYSSKLSLSGIKTQIKNKGCRFGSQKKYRLSH